jgi:hypothetical protein
VKLNIYLDRHKGLELERGVHTLSKKRLIKEAEYRDEVGETIRERRKKMGDNGEEKIKRRRITRKET